MSIDANTSVSGPIEEFNSRTLLAQIKSLPQFKPLKSKQRRFVIAFAGSGRISGAATITGIPWITHYHWLERDPQYKEAFEKAKEMFGDYAEGEVFNRAFFGEDREVFRNGNLVGKYNQKSDILAMFALKGLKPQYRDNFTVNQFAGPVQLKVSYDQKAIDPLSGTAAIDKLVDDGSALK